ncbi:MAG TPA: DNA alkylation repair protein [Vicinamibacterales bacterium]|nr:DNA alkylation repair protein [Vicinamibacterales bacterium]
MHAKEVLTQLRKLGKPNTVQIYARHGVSGPCYGVAYGDLKPLVKKIGPNHQAALTLWDSGVHDARVVATMIAEPGKMTRAQVERWLRDCDNYILTDAVSGIAALMPGALEMARAWIDEEGEWTTTAGWNVFAVSGGKGKLRADDVDGLLSRIESTIHSQPNRTRYAMNNVLIGIGGYVEPLRPRALAVARAIGTVHVDHGETGCRTPDAAGYIAKMVAHNAGKTAAGDTRGRRPAKRTRVTGANTRAPKKPPGRAARIAKASARAVRTSRPSARKRR